MNLTITLDKSQETPKGMLEALKSAMEKRLHTHWPELEVTVKKAQKTDFSLSRVSKDDRKRIMEAAEEVWEDSDGWMPMSE